MGCGDASHFARANQILSHSIISHSTCQVKKNFGPLGLHNKLTIIVRVRARWTIVRDGRTSHPRGVDKCPRSSYSCVRQRWTAVYQLRTAASSWDGQKSISCEPLGLHNKFTKLYNLHKNFQKKIFIFVYFAN